MADDFTNKLSGAAEKAEGFSGILDRLAIKGATLVGLEEKQIQATQKANKLQAQLDREKKKSVPLQRKMTIELQQRLKNSTLLNKGLKETIKSMNLFGKTMSGLKGAVGGVGKGIAAIGKAGVIGGLVVGVKFLVEGLLKIDNAMAGLSKRLGATRSELANVRNIAIGVEASLAQYGVSFEAAATEAGNLAQQFGSIKLVTEDVVKSSLRLQQVFGVSAQAAGELLESLERTNKSSEEFISNIGVKAQREGVLTSLVMKDLASQSQMIAIQSSRGAESMQNLAIEAAKAGGSLKDFAGLESTYSDVEKASAAIGRATTLMGSDIAKHMGNIQELRMMYERGETDKILERVQKATAATVKLNKEGNLVNMQGRELYRSELKAMAELAGMEESAFKLMTLSNLKEAQHLADMNADEAKKFLEDKKRRAITENERLAQLAKEDQILKDRQNILERLGNIATSVFSRIATAFSDVLGIDQTGKGTLLDTIDQLQAQVEAIFDFPNLQKDVERLGGGFTGLFGALKERFSELFDEVGTFLGDKLSAAADRLVAKLRSDSLVMRLLLGESEFEKKQDRLSELERLLAFDAKQSGINRLKQTPEQRQKMLEETVAIQKEFGQTDTAAMKELAPILIAEQQKKKDAANLAAATQMSQTMTSSGMQQVAPALMAKGGIRRGGAALVGEERRGEVVVSRSALRSGIGVGGRAAQALASIGVPGFLRGEVVAGVVGQRGLRTAAGSESARAQRARDFQEEQAIQQAAMVNYWREYYENKRDNMDRQRNKPKKDDMAFLKEFFMQNRRDLKLVSDIMLQNQHSAAKEMNEGVFAAMTAWSKGAKSGDALRLGVRAGLVESMKSGGTLNTMFKDTDAKLNKMIQSQEKTTAAIGVSLASFSAGVKGALAMYAQTGDMKAAKEQAKRSAVSSGALMLATRLFGEDAMARAKDFQVGGGEFAVPRAAKGKYVNSPTLMMVGEEGRGEVVVPTERIRKGLPINANVAAELASIGVPGFKNGTNDTSKGATSHSAMIDRVLQSRANANSAANNIVKAAASGGSESLEDLVLDVLPPLSISQLEGADFAYSPTATAATNTAQGRMSTGLADDVFTQKAEDIAKNPSNLGKSPSKFGAGAKASGAAAALSFAQVYMQTGNLRLAAQAGLEAGISMGATLAISAIPPPFPGPLVGPILGPMIGKATAGPIGKAIGLTGGQGKARRRTLKGIESHVKSGGLFDFGQPSGLRKNISVAVGGKENVPTEENYNKLVEKVGSSQVLKPLWQAGIDPSVIVAASSGKLQGNKAFNSFRTINEALYGSAGGDKYMKATAIPQLATGGIVTKPTTAVVGEAGPEMVIPLTEQRQSNDNMLKELREQNKLMKEMIKTQQETGKTEVRLDGRVIAQSTAENFYDIGNGM